jgi:hypothetical protein
MEIILKQFLNTVNRSETYCTVQWRNFDMVMNPRASHFAESLYVQLVALKYDSHGQQSDALRNFS